MTHDELLDKIEWIENTATPTKFCEVEMCERNLRQFTDALRAVVELHTPISFSTSTNLPDECGVCKAEPHYSSNALYPCPTIQAIEKELSDD